MDLLERHSANVSRHPWELARSKFFIRILRQLAPVEDDRSLLDVGSGDAWFASHLVNTLPNDVHITCWDINYSPEDLKSYAQNSDKMFLTTEEPVGTFDGILMLDVVEHIEQDVEFISGIVASRLKSDGWILVSVPAYQRLFTSHDTAVKHFRRYSPREAADVLRAGGLRIEAQGGLFHSLLAVRGSQVVKERLSGPNTDWVGAGAWRGGPRLTRAVATALSAESRVSEVFGTKTKSIVPGLSYWAFCRRANST
jgi:hypothetical protein